MKFVPIAVIFVVLSTAGDSSKEVVNQICAQKRGNADGVLLSSLHRSSVLHSPLHRFKVLNEKSLTDDRKPQHSRMVQDFHALRDKCLQNKQLGLFEDPEFDAVDSSIFYNKTNSKKYKNIKWLRPHNITNNPKFIVQGATRFDIRQGVQGDCWFMAVAADLASTNDSLFSHIVPTDQGFDDNYCGIFHFRFWQLGHWVDVVIDDRLPTRYGNLIFSESSQTNEYWGALLEKAYAKLYGSYDALNGGRETEAMEDLTGGVAIMFNLDELLPVPDMFQLMNRCMARQSLITAAMEKESDDAGETVIRKGLPNNHAYSVSHVRYVDISFSNQTDTVPLVRIRNPWGQTEWNGPWSDDAREWNHVSNQDREQLRVMNKNDGEYWMAYEDFVNTFDKVSICLINPNVVSDNPHNARIPWEVSVLGGEWVRRKTAGGCSVATLHQNPQYQIVLENPDDDSKLCTVFIGLMQESQRALRNFLKGDENYLRTGFVIYKLENASSLSKPLDSEYIQHNKWFETSVLYSLKDQREVSHRFVVPPGVYCIIPCTHHSDVEGEFILRVVTEKKNYMKHL